MTQHPGNVSVSAGQAASFTAAANGQPNPSVQWQSSTNGTSWSNISGATSTTYSIPSTTAAQDGTRFRAVFTNSAGTATTNAATLTVSTAPSVTQHPADAQVLVGAPASFTAAASGQPNPSVQWQSSTNGTSWSDIPGATSTTHSIPSAAAAQDGEQFRAVFTNSAGSATSDPATLTVLPSCAPVELPRVSAIAAPGQQARLAITGAEDGDPAVGGGRIEAPSGTRIVAVDTDLAHDVPFTISEDGRTAHSDPASFGGAAATVAVTLEVDPDVAPGSYLDDGAARVVDEAGCSRVDVGLMVATYVAPVTVVNPQDVTAYAGDDAVFTSTATGTPEPTTQWQSAAAWGGPWADVEGATGTTLVLEDVQHEMDQRFFRAVHTNDAGFVRTAVGELTIVGAAPVVTAHPRGVQVAEGGTATFTADATGDPAPEVQWQTRAAGETGWVDVHDATSAALEVQATVGDDGHEFRAVFTNRYGLALTSVAVLTVYGAPQVVQHPHDVTVYAPRTATFGAGAETRAGAPSEIQVQWQVLTDGEWVDVPGAAAEELRLEHTSPGMDGSRYRAVFTNLGGQAVTDEAALTVLVGTPLHLTVTPRVQLVDALPTGWGGGVDGRTKGADR